MKTFNVTKTYTPIVFEVNGEKFEAIPAENISTECLADYFKLIQKGDLFEASDLFLETVLTEDSYRRFNKGLNSKNNPITIKMLGDIVSWLLADEYMGGKSYGRSQVIIGFALDTWEEFGSWCLLHGVKNIWKIPSYQLCGLVMAYLKTDRMPEDIKKIDNSFAMTDDTPHPFESKEFRAMVEAMSRVITSSRSKFALDSSRFAVELPVEERKRQEAAAKGKAYRVPEWWRGEQANYKVAKSLMGVLPKRGGSPSQEE